MVDRAGGPDLAKLGRHRRLKGGSSRSRLDNGVHCVIDRLGPVDRLVVEELELDLAVVRPGTFHSLVIHEGTKQRMVAG